MKRILRWGMIGIVTVLLTTACQDFLEQPIESITNVDSVFNNPDNAMLALWACYTDFHGLNVGLRHNTSGGGCHRNSQYFGSGVNACWDHTYLFSDEASHESCGWCVSREMLFGNWSQFGQRAFPALGHIQAIRTCNLFIEYADRVPFMTTSSWNWNQAYLDQVVSEARFLRAFLHFEMFRRFGGIPIMNKLPTYEQEEQGLKIFPSGERNSVASVISFIVNECNAIIPYLPDSYLPAEEGRTTKGMALTLKAEALLYAASPLYNATTPPISYGDERDSLLCYGNVDNNRWVLARDAYADAITWAEANGYELLDDPVQGKRQSWVLGTAAARSQSPKNNEVIMMSRGHSPQINQWRFYFAGFPLQTATYAATSPGVNFVREYYRDKNGVTLDIPDEGNFVELKDILRNAEERFHASVWVPGQKYSYFNNGTYRNWGAEDTSKFVYHTLAGGTKTAYTSQARIAGEHYGFFWVKKWRQFPWQDPQKINWPFMRLSELYLGYAEAANEVNPNDVNILTHLNKVRVRGALPLLQPGDPTYDAKFGDKDLMRWEIWREWAVEHYGEDHRLFDLRRWKIADKIGGPWTTIVLYENGTGTYTNPQASWTPAQRLANDQKLSYRFDLYSTHVWDDKMYFYPWYNNEVNKGILVQNPGW